MSPGPLTGLRVVEIASIGPGPFAAMLLADMGADVVRVDRASAVDGPDAVAPDPLLRGRPSVAVDLKHRDGPGVVLRLAGQADALIEGFRPGVAERLGIGPEECSVRNRRLVYGRMTGWGQDGPLARAPGHDIDFIALAGALDPVGRAGGPPVPPLNMVGDFGGGGLLLAFGLLAALLETARSGLGQVVDAAMVDGAALLTTMVQGMRAAGEWSEARGTNLLDSGAPFYDAYECADGRWIAVGAIEPRFYAELRRVTGLDGPGWDDQHDRSRWPARKAELAAVFRGRARAEWCRQLEGGDACVAPVLSLAEAPEHPHLRRRGTFVEVAGVVQPAPAPRLSRTPAAVTRPPARPGEHTAGALVAWGVAADEVAALVASGAVRQREA